jgi:hypothetical protein
MPPCFARAVRPQTAYRPPLSPCSEIIEHALYEHILPLPPKGDDATLWTDKLLLVLRSLAEPQKRSLLALAGLSQTRANYALFVRACEEWNGGTVDENEDEVRRRKDGVFKGLSGTSSIAAPDLPPAIDPDGARYSALQASSRTRPRPRPTWTSLPMPTRTG